MSKKIFFFLSILLIPAQIYAQGIPSEGKDFYLGYIHPTYNDVVPPQTAQYFRVYAYVSSFQDNVVSISYFDPLTKKEEAPANYAVKARQTTQIILDRTRMQMANTGETPNEFKSAHITSRKPVNVQFFSTGANSGGSYLALPVNGWGKQYVVASYRDNGAGEGALLGGQAPAQLDKAAGIFMIIGAYDSTFVTITPTALTAGGHAGVNQGAGSTGLPQPYTVMLRRGQTWFVRSKSAANGDSADITGSIVKATKPVAVIAGHEDAMVQGGSVEGRTLEQREFMIEQMIPVEYWSTSGYISVPFGDSPGATQGQGDNFRIMVYDTNTPQFIKMERAGFPDEILQTSVYNVTEFSGNGDLAHFSNTAGKPFSVMQYDRRSHGVAAPFNAPTMMTIVPRDRWRNAYLGYVPTNVNEKLQAYYMTVVAIKDGVARYHGPSDAILTKNWFSDSIRVGLNGSNSFQRISALGSQKAVWNTVPGHPDLKAVVFQVSPGTSYYLQAPFPFMVYNHGNRALASDGVLGDFDGNDYFFSYALPLGMGLGSPAPRRIGITVDTVCFGWRVCLYDSNDEGGIKSITLLDDPNGDLIVGGKYQFKNVSFSPAVDPLNLKEIVLNPAKKEYCFDVRVDNPGADAVAPLYIVDVGGNGTVVQLNYKKAAVSFYPPDTLGLVLMKLDNQYIPNYIGEEYCGDYLFINHKTSAKTFTLQNVEIPQPSPFTIKSVTPKVGSLVEPGDTVRMSICFTGMDTALYLDSINFATDCFATELPLMGQAGTPLIIAEDHDFGTILVGTSKCADIGVKNVGNKPFTLDSTWLFINSGAFIFDTTMLKNKLPRTLGPGQAHKFRFCFLPENEGRDSAVIRWNTDIRPPFNKEIKSFSEFTGMGIMPGVKWDRTNHTFRADSTAEVISRVHLINNSTADAQLTRIFIDGQDADEFRIVATEYNTNPPTYAGTVLVVGDTMWVDIAFKIDMTKIPLNRHRTAALRTSATLDSLVVPTIFLEAGFDLAKVERAAGELAVSIRPNPAHDRIILEVESGVGSDVSLTMYDVLGREVFRHSAIPHSSAPIAIKLPTVSDGYYFVRVVTNTGIRVLPLEVRKR